MNHQITNNLELELLLTGPELLEMLTTSRHLDGPFGGAYRFDEIATHDWQLADAELTEDAIETIGLASEVLIRLTLVRTVVLESDLQPTK